MAKKVKTIVKLQVPAGKANPAPPVGTALGPHGVNLMEFCAKFNNETKSMGDTIVPALITIYEDRSFDFVLKSPPAAVLLKQAAGIEVASGLTGKEKKGKVTMAQVREIADKKMNDLNAATPQAAERLIIGTARSMGIEVE